MALIYPKWKKQLEELKYEESSAKKKKTSSNTLPLYQEQEKKKQTVMYVPKKALKENVKTYTYTPVNGESDFNEEEEKKWYQKILQTADAFNDDKGNVVTDTIGTILGTTVDAGLGVMKGITDIGGGIANLTSSGVAQVADWLGADDFADTTRKSIADRRGYALSDLITRVQGSIDDYSVIGDTGDEVASGVGQLAGFMATGGVGMASSSAGDSLAESYQHEDVEDWQAWTRAVGSAAISYATERMGGFLAKGTPLDEVAANKINQKISNGMLKIFTRSTLSSLAEAGEEGLEYAGNQLLDYTIDKITEATGSDGAKFKEDWDWEAFGEQVALGFLTSTVASGGMTTNAVASTKRNNNISTKEAINEVAKQQDRQAGMLNQSEQQAVDSIVNERASEIQKQNALEKELEKAITEREAAQGGILSEKNKTALRKSILSKIENGEIDISSTKISKKELAKIQEEVKKELSDGNYDLSKLEDILTPIETAQIKELEQELANTKETSKKAEIQAKIKELKTTKLKTLKSLVNDNQYLNKAVYETEMSNQQYTYDETKVKDEYEKGTRESAKTYLNNNTVSRNFVDNIAKLSKDRQTNYKFTNNQELLEQGDLVEKTKLTAEEKSLIKKLEQELNEAKTEQQKREIQRQIDDIKYLDIGGFVRKNVDGVETVLINVDSKQSLNAVVGHETKHLLEKNSLNKEYNELLFEYAKTKGDYDTYKERIERLYDGIENADIEGELAAALTGDYLFTDSKFVETLLNDKNTNTPKIIQKIKELIDDLVVRFKGTKEEKQLREVQKKFKELYKQKADTQSETQGDTETQYGLMDMFKKSKDPVKERIKYMKTLDKDSDFFYNQGKIGEMEEIYNGQGIGNFNETSGDIERGSDNSSETSTRRELSGNDRLHQGQFYNNERSLSTFEIAGDKTSATLSKEKIKEIAEKNKKNNTKSYIAVMNPNDFLKLTTNSDVLISLEEQMLKNKRSYLNVKDFVQTDPITLTYNAKTGKISTHEGRHRSIALRNSGITKVDVVINAINGDIDSGDIIAESQYSDRKVKINNLQDVSKIADTNDVSFSMPEKTTTKYSLTDNQGRELSKEQQDFFKDSKVRDANGNLLTMYHGTNHDFTIFENEFIGKNTNNEGIFGKGFYFTEKKTLADNYNRKDGKVAKDGSGKTMELYLDMKNPFYWNDIDTKEKMEAFIEQTGMPKYVLKWNNTLKNQMQPITDIKAERKFSEVLQKNGYDGVIYKYDNEVGEYVVFNSNQIKNVDNTKPTSNPDIRYSLSEDNQGNEIKPAVQKRFENSKARDENGQLKVLYHGSPRGEFTVFDKNKANPEGDWGAGFYLTDSEYDVEGNYADGGGDFDNQISRLAETLEGQYHAELTEAEKEKYQEYYTDGTEIPISWETAKEIARERLYKGYYRIDAYVNIENPAIVGQTYLFDDYGTQYNEEDFADYDEYQEATDQLIADKVDEILWDIEENIDIEAWRDWKSDLSQVIYEAYYDGGIDMETFHTKVAEEVFVDTTDSHGNIIGNEVTRQIIESLGYDGIIDPTVSSKFRNMHLDEGTTHYIVFKPNQIKNITNENPTDNPDINLSLSNKYEDIAPVGDYNVYGKDIKYYDLPFEDNTSRYGDDLEGLERELGNTQPEPQTDKPVSAKEWKEKAKKRTAEQKVEDAIRKQSYRNAASTSMLGRKILSFNEHERRTFRDSLLGLTTKTKEQLINADAYNSVRNIVNQYANREFNYIDEDLIAAKKDVRSYRIKVSENLRNQITDFKDFRKSNFGSLTFAKDGQGIDTIWQELNEAYPYLFSSEVTAEADMLYALSEFMKKDVTITEKYRLSDSEIEGFTKKVYNKIVANSLSQQDLESLEQDLTDQVERRTRQVVQNELLEEMGITDDILIDAKKINQLDLQRTDPIRVNEKIFGWKNGQIINDATINTTIQHEAERIRFLNQERDDIKALGIKPRSKESAAVQKYGEKEYVNNNGEVVPYGDNELAAEFSDVATQEKIKRAAEIIRNKYDTYIEVVNNELERMGYDPIPKRKDYMRHFQEMTDIFSKLGTPLNPTALNENNLPTDINGLTDEFKPGKSWFANAQQRKGMKTVYDAITGIDGYLDSVSNVIYHTEDIQRYRTLAKHIRTMFSDKVLDDYDVLRDEERIEALDRAFKGQNGHLAQYVAWLDEQANALAGKKGKIDRGVEELFGRKIYTVLDTAKKQVGSNMTGFNVRSAMTNFASAVQGMSKTNKIAFLKGTISTFQNIAHDDGLINKSNFLTTRFGSEQLSKKAWQKASNYGQIFMTGTDYFTANQIWRSKYFENLDKGMSEEVAIKHADDFAARVMGNRAKGTTAQIFNSKTLGLFTQFQLEVNNLWSNLIHDNKMEIEKGKIEGKTAKATASVIFNLGQYTVFANIFNSLMKSLTGSDVMLDPIDLLKDVIGGDDEEEDITTRITKAMGELVEDVPFLGTFTGGRIPISEAFEGPTTLFKKMTGQTDEYGNEYTDEDVWEALIDSGMYWLLPTGYGQLKKTTKGMKMYDDDLPIAGSYTDSGNLRFTADTDLAGKIKADLFGEYSNDEAQEYIDSGFKTIQKNNIQELVDLGMKSSEYRDYREGLTAAKETRDENEYVKYLDKNNNVYWYDKENKTLYDSNYDVSPVPVTSLEKASSIAQAFEYITNLNVSDEQKEIMFNNVANISNTDQYGNVKYTRKELNKQGKEVTRTYWYDEDNDVLYNSDYEEIDSSEVYSMTRAADKIELDDYRDFDSYEEFDFAFKNAEKYDFLRYNNISYEEYNATKESKEAYDWAYQNPEQYAVAKTVTNDIVEYKQFISDISELESDRKANGTAVSGSRKKKVIAYVNSLNLSIPQKAILIRREYSSFNDYNRQIVQYVGSLDIDYEEKISILEELDMKVNSAGYVSW